MVPQDLKYTKEHEWVRLEGEEAILGITDYAQGQLGDITFVELPSAGRDIKQSETVATVESVKAASDIYAPLSGSVVEANSSLEDSPEIINQSPYEKGWICRVKVTDTSEQNNLMDAEAYEKYLEETAE